MSVALAGTAQTSRIRCPAAGSSWPGATTRCGSRPARGCRRNGRIARRLERCCCARSSAARTIRTRSDLADAELIDIASREISAVLGIAAPPILARVYRWRNAGAQHNVGHRARMEGLAARLQSLPGLFVAGSGFRVDRHSRLCGERPPHRDRGRTITLGWNGEPREGCLVDTNRCPRCDDRRAVLDRRGAGRRPRRPRAIDPAVVKLLAEIKAQGQGAARRLRRGRPVPAADGRVERRASARSRSAARAATARSGLGWACARPAASSSRSSTTRCARRSSPTTSSAPASPTSCRSSPATRSSRFPKLPGTFDFVFLDAWKKDYKRFFDLVYPRLDKGGLFLAHNVVNKRSEMGDFLDAIQKHPRSGRRSCRRRAKGCRCRAMK